LIGLSGEQKLGAYGVERVGRVPITLHAEVATAGLAVEIVVEGSELTILKATAYETGAAGYDRSHHLNDHTDAPFFVAGVANLQAT
jgi:hypothetical protein